MARSVGSILRYVNTGGSDGEFDSDDGANRASSPSTGATGTYSASANTAVSDTTANTDTCSGS